MNTKKAVVFLVLFVGFFVFSNETFAQSLINTNAHIEISPISPEANQKVTASLNAYSINTNGATILWYIDGIEVPDTRNEREIEFTTGELNEEMEVSVNINLPSGSVLSPSKIVTPTRVDIIVESDSIVPAHYKGRALPSYGSLVRVVAIPFTELDPRDLSYKWSVDNKVLYGGSLVGKNVATFEATLRGNSRVTVDIFDKNGISISRKSIFVNIANPEIYFYENNPLRGLSRNAISSSHTLVGEEITVRAEPYYVSKNIFQSDHLVEWKIDNKTTENSGEDKQTITLRRAGGSGNFNVNFYIRNIDNLLEGAEEEFILTF